MEPNKTLPVKVTLSNTLKGNLNKEEILKGQRLRTIINFSDLTVASFGKKYVLQKPDFLYSMVSKNQPRGDEFDALVKFGDDENNLFLKIRSSKDSNSSNNSKKKQLVSITFSLFLEEDDELAMLYPKGKLMHIYRHLIQYYFLYRATWYRIISKDYISSSYYLSPCFNLQKTTFIR